MIRPFETSPETRVQKTSGAYVKLPPLKYIALIIIIGLPLLSLLIYGLIGLETHVSTKVKKINEHNVVSDTSYLKNDDGEYALWKNSLDESADPCDNFYEFACGQYIAEHPIKNQSQYEFNSASQMLKEENDQCFSNAVFNVKPSRSEAVQKFRQFQAKFMDVQKLNRIGTKNLVRDIEDFGGCPLISGPKWNPKNFNLADALLKMAKSSGMFYLFRYQLVKLADDSELVLGFEPSTLTISKPSPLFVDMFGNLLPKMSETFSEFLEKMFKIVMDDRKLSTANLSKSVDKITEFETTLLKTYWDYGHYNASKLPNSTAVYFYSLAEFMTSINSTNFFLESPQIPPELRETLHSNFIVYMGNIPLMGALNSLYLETDPSLLANYLCARYLFTAERYLDQRFHKAREEFDTQLLGVAIKKTRKDDLLDAFKFQFPRIADHLYTRDCVNMETLTEIKEITTNIQSSVKDLLFERNWLDSDSLKLALKKLKKTRVHIGALEVAFDIDALDERYKDLDFQITDTLRQLHAKTRLHIEKFALSHLLRPDEYTSAENYLAMTQNLMNIPTENRVYLFAGEFVPPHYNPNQSLAVNYGAMGTGIAHEFWHSFDISGVRFNEDGKLMNWLSEVDIDKLITKSRCFVDQYAKQVINPFYKRRNTLQTLKEDLCDNAGLQASYKAYKKILNGKEEKRVKGYERYTNDQAFFISYATQWCYTSSNVAKINRIIKDRHSAEDIRVNTVLWNMPEFGRAFNCPLRSRMNPVDKCYL